MYNQLKQVEGGVVWAQGLLCPEANVFFAQLVELLKLQEKSI